MTEVLGEAVLDLGADLTELVRKLQEARYLTKTAMDSMSGDVAHLRVDVLQLGPVFEKAFGYLEAGTEEGTLGLTEAEKALGALQQRMTLAGSDLERLASGFGKAALGTGDWTRELGRAYDTLWTVHELAGATTKRLAGVHQEMRALQAAVPALTTSWVNKPLEPAALYPPAHQIAQTHQQYQYGLLTREEWKSLTGPLTDSIEHLSRVVEQKELGPGPSAIPDYSGVQLGHHKDLGKGTHPTQIAHEMSGREWFIKSYGEDVDKVATELLANSILRALDIAAPKMGKIVEDGVIKVAYKLEPGDIQVGDWTPAMKATVAKSLVGQALINNWDFVGGPPGGLHYGNVLWKGSQPTYLDQGGSFMMKGLEGQKPLGANMASLWDMLTKGQAAQAGLTPFLTPQGIQKQAQVALEKLTPDLVTQLVSAAPFSNKGMQDTIETALLGKLDHLQKIAEDQSWIPSSVSGRMAQGTPRLWGSRGPDAPGSIPDPVTVAIESGQAAGLGAKGAALGYTPTPELQVKTGSDMGTLIDLTKEVVSLNQASNDTGTTPQPPLLSGTDLWNTIYHFQQVGGDHPMLAGAGRPGESAWLDANLTEIKAAADDWANGAAEIRGAIQDFRKAFGSNVFHPGDVYSHAGPMYDAYGNLAYRTPVPLYRGVFTGGVGGGSGGSEGFTSWTSNPYIAASFAGLIGSISEYAKKHGELGPEAAKRYVMVLPAGSSLGLPMFSSGGAHTDEWGLLPSVIRGDIKRAIENYPRAGEHGFGHGVGDEWMVDITRREMDALVKAFTLSELESMHSGRFLPVPYNYTPNFSRQGQYGTAPYYYPGQFLPPGHEPPMLPSGDRPVWMGRPLGLPSPGTTVGGRLYGQPDFTHQPGSGGDVIYVGPGGTGKDESKTDNNYAYVDNGSGGGAPPVAVSPSGGGGGGGGGSGWGAFFGGLMGHPGGRGRGFPLFGLWGPRVGGGLAAFGSLGSFAGLGPERILMTALSVAGSAAGAAAGAGTLGLGALGQMAVGQGSDMAVMKSTITDTKTLAQQLQTITTNQQLYNNAVATYGKNSTQAASALGNLQQSQAAFNQQVQAFGGPNAIGVKAEIQLAKNKNALNTFWDQQTQGARVAAANILEQVVQLGHTFVPLVAQTALQNLTVINNNIKPLFAWLQGPQGISIWHTLEDNFLRVLPTAIHAGSQAFEVLLRYVSIASNYTGGFVAKLDQVFTRLNQKPNSSFESVIQKLVGDFRLWEQFIKMLFIDLRDLFKLDAGLGNSLIATLTGMLERVHKYETSTRGSAQIMSIFSLHKQEVLELVKLFGHLASAFSHVYLAVAPSAVAVMNNVVLPVLNAVGSVLTDISKASPLAADALGALLIGWKFGGWGAVSGALKGVLGLFKGLVGAEAASVVLGGAGGAAGAGAAGTAASTAAKGGGAAATAAEAGAGGAAAGGVLSRILGFGGRMAGDATFGGTLKGFLGGRGVDALLRSYGADSGLMGPGFLDALKVGLGRSILGLSQALPLALGGFVGAQVLHFVQEKIQPTSNVYVSPSGQVHTQTSHPFLEGLLPPPPNPTSPHSNSPFSLFAQWLGFGGPPDPKTVQVGGGNAIQTMAKTRLNPGDTLNISEVGRFAHWSASQLESLQGLLASPGIKVKVDGVKQSTNDVKNLVDHLSQTKGWAAANLQYVKEMLDNNFKDTGKHLAGLVDAYKTNLRLISSQISLNTAEGRRLADHNMQLMVSGLTHQMALGHISVSKGMSEIMKVIHESVAQGYGTWKQRWGDYFSTLESLYQSGRLHNKAFFADIHKGADEGWKQIQASEKANVDKYIAQQQHLHDKGFLTYKEMMDNIHAYQLKQNDQANKDWATWTGNVVAGIQNAMDAGKVSQKSGLDQIRSITGDAWDKIRAQTKASFASQEQDLKTSLAHKEISQGEYNTRMHALRREENQKAAADLSIYVQNLAKAATTSGHVTWQGALSIVNELNQALKPLHAGHIPVPRLDSAAQQYVNYHLQGIGAQSGAMYQIGQAGQVGADSVPLSINGYPIIAAPGEVVTVFNRHQLPEVDAGLRLRGYSGLRGLFGSRNQRHADPMASGGYVYPFAPGTSLSRTDEGVDASMPVGSPIGPIGDGQVYAYQPGWYAGQPLIAWTLTNGPLAGKQVYLAEQITGYAMPGKHVKANQAVASFAPSGSGIEMGWMSGSQTLAKATTGYTEGQVTPAGLAFRAFLAGLSHGVIIGGGGIPTIPHIKTPGVVGPGAYSDSIRAGLTRAGSAANKYLQSVYAKLSPAAGTFAGSSSGVVQGPGVHNVVASAESLGGSGYHGNPILAYGYSELGVPPTAANVGTAMGSLPYKAPLFIRSGTRVVEAYKQDIGTGSSFDPVMGLYPGTVGQLGLSGGQFQVSIERPGGAAFDRGGMLDYAGRFGGGGAYTATRPTMAVFGENGPETAMFIPHAASGALFEAGMHAPYTSKPPGATGQTKSGTWYKGSGSNRMYWEKNFNSGSYSWLTGAQLDKIFHHRSHGSSGSTGSSHHHHPAPKITDPLMFRHDPYGDVRGTEKLLEAMGFPVASQSGHGGHLDPAKLGFQIAGESLADLTKKGFAALLHAVTHFFHHEGARALAGDIRHITKHAGHLANHVLELKSDIFTVKHLLKSDHLSHKEREHLQHVLHEDLGTLHDDNKQLHRDQRLAATAMGVELGKYSHEFNQESAAASSMSNLFGALGGLSAGTSLSTVGLRNPAVLRAMGLLPKTGHISGHMLHQAIRKAELLRGTTSEAYRAQAHYIETTELPEYAKDQHHLERLYREALKNHNNTVAKHVLKELQTVTDARIQAEADLQAAQVSQIDAIYSKAQDKTTTQQGNADLVGAITGLNAGTNLAKLGITKTVLNSLGISPAMAKAGTSLSYFQNLESNQGGTLTADQIKSAHDAVHDQNKLLEGQQDTDQKALKHLEKMLPSLTGSAKTEAQKNIENLVNSIVGLQGTMQQNNQALKDLTKATNSNTTATGQMTGSVSYQWQGQEWLASDTPVNVGGGI